MVVGSLIGAAILAAGFILVRTDAKRRAAMTKAEREAEDASHDSDQLW